MAENGPVTLPTNLTYEVGSKSLCLYYLGLLLAQKIHYEEVGDMGENSNSIRLLFAAEKNDEFQAVIKK